MAWAFGILAVLLAGYLNARAWRRGFLFGAGYTLKRLAVHNPVACAEFVASEKARTSLH